MRTTLICEPNIKLEKDRKIIFRYIKKISETINSEIIHK